MSMYEQFQTSKDMECDGIYIEYEGFRVCIARSGGGNKRYSKALERATRPHRRAIATESMNNERAEKLMMDVYAETCVKGWDQEKVEEDGSSTWIPGIEPPEKDGELLPVTKENVLATFERLPDLYRDLQAQSNNGTLYRESLREDAAKNS